MTIKTILIVDDTQTDLLNLQSIINSAGYNVISASSGSEAVQRAKKDRPDLIFMDIVMDEVNVTMLAEQLKKTLILQQFQLYLLVLKSKRPIIYGLSVKVG